MQRARSRNAIPAAWLFTDERLGGTRDTDPLWQAVAALPRGGGIVLRHYSWLPPARHALLARLARLARARGLLLLTSGLRATGQQAAGIHRPRHDRRAAGHAPRRGLVSASAHSRRELVQAFASGADLVFLSPVFATQSHPGGAPLGPVRFGLAARASLGPVIALGGMTPARARRLQSLGASGFAAIGWWGPGAGPAAIPESPAPAADR